MRPEILHPLFATIDTLDGVGPKIAKALAKLKLDRLVDLLFHLPTGSIQRIATDALGHHLVGQRIVITLTPIDLREGRGRSPLRIYAKDGSDNMVALTFFNRAGWAKTQFPLGEAVRVSGRLDAYGEDLQMVHPDLVKDEPPLREPVYPLSEGVTNKRMREFISQALRAAPDLPEWIEPSVKADRGWLDWRSALAAVHSDSGNDGA